jgi:leader peptidase (prepilin peptidase) / N-methyltransferase
VNTAAAVFVLAPALALGSFLNVVVFRVPARRSILLPPSSCGVCATEILWRDNVPVVSYLLLRGRCRQCAAPISPLYPVVEVVTAGLVVACFAAFGATAWAALAAGFCAVLVVLSVIDAQHRTVPNRVVLPSAAVALVAHTAIDPSFAWLLWSLVATGALLIGVLAYPHALGSGEVKLALLLALMLGASVTVAMLIGLVAALIAFAVQLSSDGASARKMGTPFVPFLSLGAVIALFFGGAILDASLALF